MFHSHSSSEHVLGRSRRRAAAKARRARKLEGYTQRRAQLEGLEARTVMAVDPVISEFQATNTSTIKDFEGQYEDWIEIRNGDVAEVNMAGWYLTDDKTNLTKWQFPAGVKIPAGDEILVFASNKNLRDPAKELHTNFRLAGDGEFLALVRPDGRTISQKFDPYPAQVADQSYGLAITRDVFPLVTDNAAAKAFVPTDGSLGKTWQDVGFNDASWTAGTLGAGYEVLAPAYHQLEEFDAPLGNLWTTSVPAGSTATVNVTGGNLVMTVPSGQNVTASSRGTAPMVYRTMPDPFPTDYEIITRVQQTSADRGAAGIAIINPTTGLPAIQLEYTSRATFAILANGASLVSKASTNKDAYTLRLARDGVAGTWTGYYRLNEVDNWTTIGTITDGVNGTPIVDNPVAGIYARTPSSTMNASFNYFDVNVLAQKPVYGPQTGLNLDATMRNKNSSVYLRIPFNYNGTAQLDELDLTTSYDDGFVAYLNGVEIASDGTPIAGVEWNSVAGVDQGAVFGKIPVRTFSAASKLSALRQGQNVLTIQGLNVAANDEDFFFDAQLVAADVLASSNQFFVSPTPNASNLLPAAPTPQIGGTQGTFFGSTEVTMTITNPLPYLEIRYTTDGTDPLPTSTLYTGPITLNRSAMLQARTYDNSVRPSFQPSNISAGTFVAVDVALQSRTSDLPILVLDSLTKRLASADTNSLTSMDVVLFDVDKATGRSLLGGSKIDYLGRGGARDRGSSTAGQPKPNMAFETWGTEGNSADDDDSASLLGLPSDSDWVLHAPYDFDRALFRNQLAYEMSNEMGMWAPRFRHVEVYFNRNTDGVVTEADYHGVYVLMEKIKQGKDRVDVKDIDTTDNAEPDISGGYMWKVDRNDPDATTFTAGGQAINWVYPKSPVSRTATPDQKATAEQQAWVIDYFNKFRATLTNPDINDPEGYSKYIDPQQWADQHMVNVWMMNVDALRLSAYFNKDRGKRIEYGPMWDFDRAAESTDGRDDDPLVWRSEVPDFGTDFFGNGTQQWWGDLFKDPGFWQLYVDRWQYWRQSVLSDDNISATIDNMANDVRESEARNIAKWTATKPRTGSGYNHNTLDGTYQGEVNNLKTWLLERAHFMDNNFAKQAQLLVRGEVLGDVDGALVNAGEQVTLQSPPLEYFVDTKLVSSAPNGTVGKYFVPKDDTLAATWAATNFNDAGWVSGPTGFGFQPSTQSDFNGLIATTVNTAAVDPTATTILARIPFQISDVNQARQNRMILKAQYDDGMVLYINGTEVKRLSIRDATLSWTSRANSRTNTVAKTVEEIDLSAFSNLLVQGTNILGIRLINSSATNGDMLFNGDLLSRKVEFGVNPAAKVYYTTDGTDPRGANGQPSASAILLPNGQKLTIQRNTRLIARNFDDSDRGEESAIVRTDWSGPIQYNVVVQQPALVISEINYHPEKPTAAQAAAGLSADDFEFVEIHNPSNATVDLVGIRLSNGVDFDFFNSTIKTIPAGGYVLVVKNKAAFEQRYGAGKPIAGQFTGNLDDAGEQVTLKMGNGDKIFEVGYSDSDPWPAAADGLGATLQLVSPANTAVERQGKWYSWQSSAERGGSPGAAGKADSGIVINELLVRTDAPVTLTDSIELYNSTNAPINIGGWFLSDSTDNLFKYQIPAGAIVAAGGYLVFNEAQFNAANDPEGFALGDGGDSVYLVRGSVAGGVTEFIDDVTFRAQLNGEAIGRVPNGSGRFTTLSRTSLSAANATPRVGPVVISEVQYNPVPSAAALAADPTLEASDLEFLEIWNPTASQIDISNWHVRGGASYDFVANTKLAPNEKIVLLKFDPADPQNVNQVNAFRAQYGITASVRLVGGYSGQLNNADDRVTLLRPDVSADPVNPPYVQVDEVLYDDLAPWATGADGASNSWSLQRVSATAFGNDATSWFAGPGSPGAIVTSLPGDFDGNRTIDAIDINLLYAQLRAPAPNVQFDLTGDGKVDTSDRDRMIFNIVGTTFGDSNLDKVFNSSDFVFVFQEGQYEDGIVGNSKWETGDWDGDGEFSTTDLVLAFQTGGFSNAATPAQDDQVSSQLIAAAVAGSAHIAASDNNGSLPGDEVADAGPAPATRLAIAASVDSIFDAEEVEEILSDELDLIADVADDLLGG